MGEHLDAVRIPDAVQVRYDLTVGLVQHLHLVIYLDKTSGSFDAGLLQA